MNNEFFEAFEKRANMFASGRKAVGRLFNKVLGRKPKSKGIKGAWNKTKAFAGKHKGKLAIGAGVGAAGAYGLHKKKQNGGFRSFKKFDHSQ